jgi:SAM-dependent methyltransferase
MARDQAATDNGHDPSPAWLKAQAGERGYWQRVTSDRDYLDEHADDFRRDVGDFMAQIERCGFVLGPESRVLQVGPGLFDLVDFLPECRRHSVEPLESYFASLEEPHRCPTVERHEGPAESLPFPDGSMDLVISHNMLDHVSSPGAVMSECFRVLRPDGRMWLSVEVFSSFGIAVKRLLLALRVDPKHLWFWSGPAALSVVRGAGFDVLEQKAERHPDPILSLLRRGHWRSAVKRILGIWPTAYTLVARRPSGEEPSVSQ